MSHDNGSSIKEKEKKTRSIQNYFYETQLLN